MVSAKMGGIGVQDVDQSTLHSLQLLVEDRVRAQGVDSFVTTVHVSEGCCALLLGVHAMDLETLRFDLGISEDDLLACLPAAVRQRVTSVQMDDPVVWTGSDVAGLSPEAACAAPAGRGPLCRWFGCQGRGRPLGPAVPAQWIGAPGGCELHLRVPEPLADHLEAHLWDGSGCWRLPQQEVRLQPIWLVLLGGVPEGCPQASVAVRLGPPDVGLMGQTPPGHCVWVALASRADQRLLTRPIGEARGSNFREQHLYGSNGQGSQDLPQ